MIALPGFSSSRKERALGIARGKRRYDLPLGKSPGTGFLVLLICLMTFLATLALAASYALSAITTRWSSGLENSATVELPAETADGALLTRAEIQALASRIDSLLAAEADVIESHVLDETEIAGLVAPWLGDDLALADLPLPGLISLELRDKDIKTVKLIENRIRTIHPNARIDAHEEWLSDLLRFTGALQFAAALLTLVIGVTMVAAVAGAVRARLAVHHAEVELLHLMGARDSYIARQFQRHSLILALQGALAGLAAGALALAVIGWIAGEMGVSLLPGYRPGAGQIAALAALPAVVALIAVAAARHTVLKVLAAMP